VGRLSVGENTAATDGRGSLAKAVVSGVTGAEVTLQVSSVDLHQKPSPEIWLAQALAKGDRDEQAIQACTELGVDRVIPFAAGRSISSWRGDKVEKGVLRWTKIVTEATKQSLRAWVPFVTEPHTIAELCTKAGECEIVVLDPLATAPLSVFRPSGETPILVVVGPEGGLSPEELNEFENAGATRYRLGDTVLRTSSAGPAALAVLNVTLGRWDAGSHRCAHTWPGLH
jgi:16S rRNA (uracil1498-N3)-methyltransferase